MDRQGAAPGGGGQADPPGVQADPGGQEAVAAPEVDAARAEIGTALVPGGDHHGVARTLRILLRHDEGGAGGRWCAGEDPHGLAVSHGAGKAAAGRALADHGQGDGRSVVQARRRDRIAVHGRRIEGRLVPAGGQGFGQGPAQGLRAGGDRFRRQGGDGGQHGRPGRLHRHQADRAHAPPGVQSPDLPPVLDRSRTPSMTMPFSAAFSMS